MRRLSIVIGIIVIIGITVISIKTAAINLNVYSRAVVQLNRAGTVTPDIWKKFIGEETAQDVEDIPDLADFSHAGFRNGEEAFTVCR